MRFRRERPPADRRLARRRRPMEQNRARSPSAGNRPRTCCTAQLLTCRARLRWRGTRRGSRLRLRRRSPRSRRRGPLVSLFRQSFARGERGGHCGCRCERGNPRREGKASPPAFTTPAPPGASHRPRRSRRRGRPGRRRSPGPRSSDPPRRLVPRVRQRLGL